MTTAWVGFDVSLRMVVCHGLLELAVLLIIAIDEKEREFNRNKQLQIVASLATLVPLILQHLEDQREMANDLELLDDIPMDMDYELAPPMVVVD